MTASKVNLKLHSAKTSCNKNNKMNKGTHLKIANSFLSSLQVYETHPFTCGIRTFHLISRNPPPHFTFVFFVTIEHL